jgi:hypothetical protein
MYGQVHANLVLYKVDRARGGALPTYRQIAIVEMEQFQVRIFGGDVVQKDPKFIAETADAEVYFHSTLQAATDDAQKEFKQSVDSGEWLPYDPVAHTP